MPPYIVAKGVNNLSKDDKLIKRMTAKPIPSDIEFKEFRRYLEMYGFKLDRTNGSHNIFIHPNSIDIYSIPTVNGKTVKPQYIKMMNQVIALLEDK